MNDESLDRIVEKSLREEPEFQLPVDFASKVTFKIVRKKQWKTDLKDYLYLSGLLMLIGIFTLVFYYFLDQTFALKVWGFLSSNAISIVLLILLLNFILLADKVLLRMLFSRWNPKFKTR